jgi:YjbE family integral membrane protein
VSFLADPEFWARWLSIVILDLTLAGDNALVIALAVRSLPRGQQFWGRIWGSMGAVALRLLFITIITYLLRIPLLQVAGGLLLIWIALKLVRQGADEGGEGHVRHGTSLWEAVWIIIVADVVMSLDNVLAVAGAAHGNLVLVVFGIALSLPLVVWVAGEMILKDDLVRGWLGEAAHLLHYPLPVALGIILSGLGWWFARAARPAPGHP